MSCIRRPAYRNEILTLAALRDGEGGPEILFNESHRIFGLGTDLEKADELIARLKEHADGERPVKARVDVNDSVVTWVDRPSDEELARFEEARTYLDEPDEIYDVKVAEIDPTIFNLVDYGLKIPTFRLCDKIMPDYATARRIFDFCAAQSCHLPTPPTVTPCIPFQYVRDGCYARAHKMRWIIQTKFGFCCEKVFSFANVGLDRLAVRANKWGGCCVTWWYHVAPLVRVKVLNLFTVALVIDPGMFDKPVLLSTWLAAQENTSCDPNANVSKYTIQPGSAYTPANGQGTQFTTDPNYVATNQTLIAYKNLQTC